MDMNGDINKEHFFEQFKKDFVKQIMNNFEEKIIDILEGYLIELGDEYKHKVIFQFEFDKIAADIDELAGRLILNELKSIRGEDYEQGENN